MKHYPADMSTSLHTGNETDSSERDEVREIQRLSRGDNRRIQVWRFLMLTVILSTAVREQFLL